MAQQLERPSERMPARRERDPFTALRDRMDRLFEDFTGAWEWPLLREVRPFEWRMEAFIPRVDIKDEDNQLKVEAELPGVSEKDVELSISGDMLMISGEKKQEKEEKEKGYYRVERSYGSFQRAIPLPVDVDRDKVQASFKNGVLTVTLPKSPEAMKQTKKIPIKAEQQGQQR